MRLITFRHENYERIGVQIDSNILDLSRVSKEIPTDMKPFLMVGEKAFDQAREALASTKKAWLIQERDVVLLAPLTRPDKILCIGHNYKGHIGIGKTELPEYPNLFCKTANTIIAHNQPIVIPPITTQVDFEAELMAVIGRRARNVSEVEAQACIAGYTIFNDVSARDYQKRTSQWMFGKSFDTFGPMGQALVTTDEIPNPENLNLELTVNGILQQRVNTSDMIFRVPQLISYISQAMTLEVGDVIATGTPAKLPEAAARGRFLQAGDVVEITIDKIGRLRNPVVDAAGV
jgi:acylpyruvate hydrolase